MAIEIRPAVAQEMEQVGWMASYVYGGSFGDGPDNITATSINPEWTLCAFDGPTMATSYAWFPFTMRANGRALSFAGVTAVGTLPEYRRQGIVRRIVTESLARQREQGQCVAGLWASQAAIYQRYGYAAAGVMRRYAIDIVDVNFNREWQVDADVRRVMLPEALDLAKPLYREFIAQRTGYLHRSQALWRNNAFQETDAGGPVYLALAERDGVARGYVIYTLRSGKVAHAARQQEIEIRDLVWLDAGAYTALWEYLARHDLVGRIVWPNAPIDDPAPVALSEPRMLHTRDEEGSWIRIVDVPAALAGRGYLADGALTIGVSGDDLAPWNNGTWTVTADGGECCVEETATEPEIRLSVTALSLLFTGMYVAQDLHRWGLLEGSSDAVSRAAVLFQVHSRPHCPDHY